MKRSTMKIKKKIIKIILIQLQSHGDDHSDREDDLRDCDSSDEGVNVNSHMNGNNGMDYQRSPTHNTDSSHLR